MRYFLFSLISHIVIAVFALETMKDQMKFEHVGNPKVSFTMVGASEKISGSSENFNFKKQIPQQEKKIKKKTVKKTTEEVKIRKKKVAKKHVMKNKKEEGEKKTLRAEKKNEKFLEKETVDEPNIVLEKSSEASLDLEGKTQEGKDVKVQNSQKIQVKNGFIKLNDGSIAAKNQGVKGLSYGFLYQPEPNYPEIAKKLGVNSNITIKVRFLIGYDGHVEDIKFYDDIEKFGFRNEVKKALNQWKSTPITVNGDKVKLYFYKKFKFEKN